MTLDEIKSKLETARQLRLKQWSIPWTADIDTTGWTEFVIRDDKTQIPSDWFSNVCAGQIAGEVRSVYVDDNGTIFSTTSAAFNPIVYKCLTLIAFSFESAKDAMMFKLTWA